MKLWRSKPPAIRHVTLNAVSRLTRSERRRLTLLPEVALLVLDLIVAKGSILAMYQAGRVANKRPVAVDTPRVNNSIQPFR